MERKFVLILMALTFLCIPVLGQMTANDWLEKGNALANLGKYDEAIKAYDKAIEINPQYAEAWDNKGSALDALGKYDESIKCFDSGREIKNISWLVALLGTIFVALLGYFLKYYNDLRLSQRDAKLERVNKQLSELYGPLYALAIISKKLFQDLSEYLGKTGPDNNWILTEEEKEKWMLWMRTIFMPYNETVSKIIQTKADLLIEDELHPILLNLSTHIGNYKVLMKIWEAGDKSEIIPKENKYPDDLLIYAAKSFKDLKNEQGRLLGDKAKQA